MPAFFIVVIIGVSLGMDAFSLSLAYGTCKLSQKNTLLLSVIVGMYHFIMPLIGLKVGQKIIYLLPIDTNFLVFIVLLLIGIEMILESFKEERPVKCLKIIEMLLFGFAVSLDSFSVGFGLKVIYSSPLFAAFIFSLISFIFTYLGLRIGKRMNLKLGNLATLLGGIALILVGIKFLL